MGYEGAFVIGAEGETDLAAGGELLGKDGVEGGVEGLEVSGNWGGEEIIYWTEREHGGGGRGSVPQGEGGEDDSEEIAEGGG